MPIIPCSHSRLVTNPVLTIVPHILLLLGVTSHWSFYHKHLGTHVATKSE